MPLYKNSWTPTNDGAGSGLDADLLGGVESSGYARLNSTLNQNSYLYVHRSGTPSPALYVNQTDVSGDIARFFIGASSSATSGTNQVSIGNTGNITASGAITTPTLYCNIGSETTPSITFTGDTDTGLYSTANILYVTAGGTKAVYFNATEQYNYGSIYLTTTDDIAADATTTFRDSSPLYFRSKYWNGTASTNVDWNLIADATAATATDNRLLFRVSTTTKLTLTNSGDLTAVGNVTAYSDIRLKTDLTKIDNALNKVQQLTGYTFTRIDSGERQTGIIAQDLQKVLPEAVIDNGEHLSVAYGNLVGLLIEAIKELKQEIEELKK